MQRTSGLPLDNISLLMQVTMAIEDQSLTRRKFARPWRERSHVEAYRYHAAGWYRACRPEPARRKKRRHAGDVAPTGGNLFALRRREGTPRGRADGRGKGF